MIVLDVQKNVYVRQGLEYDRVSTVLQKVGIIDPTWYTAEGALRGTYVHEACALFDKNSLDWNDLDPRIRPYVEAWGEFRKDSAVRFLNTHIEQKLWSEVYGVAGTTDRLEKEDNRPVILDIKTGDSGFAGIQTAAYETMFDCLPEPIFTKKPNRYVVRLTDMGKYKLIPLKENSDRTIWQSAMNVYRFNNPRRM